MAKSFDGGIGLKTANFRSRKVIRQRINFYAIIDQKKMELERAKDVFLTVALAQTFGNRSEAARLLGMCRPALQQRIAARTKEDI